MNQHFASLVVGLAAQADQALNGQLPGGLPAGVSARDVARNLIDTLAVLEQKTRGNVDADEAKLLAEALTQLRFRFVTTEKPGQGGPVQ
ncbi:MAG TPA: DUF1844 domain-containing protein [Gemmatimonadales bacterium]|nr:DUF1844 domain-containing protein [Gemmatimonadales bacterium]